MSNSKKVCLSLVAMENEKETLEMPPGNGTWFLSLSQKTLAKSIVTYALP